MRLAIDDKQLAQETLLALGADWISIDGQTLPPLSIGAVCLLHTLGSPVLSGQPVSYEDVSTAVAVLETGKQAVQTVYDAICGGYLPVLTPKTRVSQDTWQDLASELAAYLEISLAGWTMIQPAKESGCKKSWLADFDGYWLASLVSVCHKATGYDPEHIIWSMPLVAVGHYYASTAATMGARVSRDIDLAEDMATLEKLYNTGVLQANLEQIKRK